MHNFLKVPKFTIITIIIILLTFFSSLIFISKYKVEESFKTTITVSNDSSKKIIISSDNIYKIDYDSRILLYFNDIYHEYSIDFISRSNEKFIVDIEPLYKYDDKLIPGSMVNANVVYSADSILHIILNYFN